MTRRSIEIFEKIFSGITKTQWRAGGATTPLSPPNEITLCTEVYREPPFWVPVSPPPVHPWAPLPPLILKSLATSQPRLMDRSSGVFSICFAMFQRPTVSFFQKYTHTMPVYPRVALWAIKPKKQNKTKTKNKTKQKKKTSKQNKN